ncbi:hypothetical protein [Nonomuraea dietziae]|uniref:hypothetical protein n=1 Tax=Nonomuraea dietziae TaxID=65515 RepID=UPI0031D6019A
MRRTLRLPYAWQVRTRAAVLVAASAAVLVAVAVTVVALAANADEFGPPELKRALALRVTQVLEQATLQEHREHGHHFGEHDGQVVCAVAPFGVHPEGAVKVAEVRWVYAHHMCAVTGARQSWATSVRAAGPHRRTAGGQAHGTGARLRRGLRRAGQGAGARALSRGGAGRVRRRRGDRGGAAQVRRQTRLTAVAVSRAPLPVLVRVLWPRPSLPARGSDPIEPPGRAGTSTPGRETRRPP